MERALVDGKRSREGSKREKGSKRLRKNKNGHAVTTEISTSKFMQPKLLTGATLHDYQLEGVAWLISLYENGLNGILADDMGLGKTIQAIAFFAYLVENGVSGPFLIVSPLATLDHWCAEFKRYAPEIGVVSYYGSKGDRKDIRRKYFGKNNVSKSSVIITTYDMVIQDFKSFVRYHWKYLVTDEGHRLKNTNSVLLRQLRGLKTSSRLLLSGTPLQNNMSELWTLLNFLLPEIFSDIDLFQAWFDDGTNFTSSGRLKKIDSKSKKFLQFDPEIITKVHDILRPFLLRRLKSTVLSHLPPKREYVIYSPISDVQLMLYKETAQGNIRKFLEEELLKAHDPNGAKKFRERDEIARQKGAAPQYDEEIDYGKIDEDMMAHIYDGDEIALETEASLESHQAERQLDDDYESDLASDDFSTNSIRPKRRCKSTRKRLIPEDITKIKNKQKTCDTEVNVANNEDYLDYQECRKQLSARKLMNWISTLRLVCNSPFLVGYPFNIPEDEELGLLLPYSGKMGTLDVLCRGLIRRGHRILIFSQFLSMLDVIEDWATMLRNWKVCRIDGRTKYEDRMEAIESFNTDESNKIFLLSTRAGGLGLNLSSADTVILFDSDWNPQMDLQAMDRAHRMGQKKPVIVYRLATCNTIEQRVLELASNKRELEKMVIEKGDFSGFNREHPAFVDEPGSRSEMVVALADLMSDEHLKTLKETQKNDCTLSSEVLEKLFDRSPEAYSQRDTDLPSFIISTDTI